MIYQIPYVQGAFIDMECTRCQSASVSVEPCEDVNCSNINALHKCKIHQWVKSPNTTHTNWVLSCRASHGYMLYFYCQETTAEANVPQVIHIGNVLVLKLAKDGSVVDMKEKELEWVGKNIMSML